MAMFKQFIGKLFGWSATPVRRSGPQRSPALCVERLEARDNPSTFGTATLMDFLPTGYQYGPNSGSDPVFQQGNAAWMAATMSSGSGTVVTDSNTVGSGILSDILTMASNPWTTTTGFVSGIGSTFMDGSAADSLTGAAVQMADTMFGWTEISIFQAENFGPKFGNQEAFNNGQTVGVIWGTANNVVLLANSVYNLPANIQILANATGSLVFTTAEGLQIVAGGIATIEAAVPVVVNGAIAIDATIAIATGPLGGVPGNVIAMTVTNSGGSVSPNPTTGTSTTMNVGEHALQADHNWSQIFGNTPPTLSDIAPYINNILSNPRWVKIGDAHGPGGVLIGEILEAHQNFNGVTVWVRILKDLAGNIIVNNAGAL